MAELYRHDFNGPLNTRIDLTAPTTNTIGASFDASPGLQIVEQNGNGGCSQFGNGLSRHFMSGVPTLNERAFRIGLVNLAPPGTEFGWNLALRTLSFAEAGGYRGYRFFFSSTGVAIDRLIPTVSLETIYSQSYPAAIPSNGGTSEIALTINFSGGNQILRVYKDGVQLGSDVVDNNFTTETGLALGGFASFPGQSPTTGLHVNYFVIDDAMPGGGGPPPSNSFRPYYNNHTYR